MPSYQGSCHCGAVRFRARLAAEIVRVTECNCSMCRRKGALYQAVANDDLEILSGASELVEYRFNTRTATHFFCRVCGIHPFHRPRVAPGRFSVNVRCLDGIEVHKLGRDEFDGENWEQAASRRAEVS